MRPTRARRKPGQLAHEIALDLLEKAVREIARACRSSRSGQEMLRAAFRLAQSAGQDYIDLGVTQWADAAGVSPDTISRQAGRFCVAGAGSVVSLVLKGSRGRELQTVWRIQRPNTFDEALALSAEGRLPGRQRSPRAQRTVQSIQAKIETRIAEFCGNSPAENPQIASLREGLSSVPSEPRKDTSTPSHPHTEESGMVVSQEEQKVLSTEQAVIAEALQQVQGFEEAGAKSVAKRFRGDKRAAEAIRRWAPELLRAIEAETTAQPIRNAQGILSFRILHRQNWIMQQVLTCESKAKAFSEEKAILAERFQGLGIKLPELPDHLLAMTAFWQNLVSHTPSADSPGYHDHLDTREAALRGLIQGLRGHLGEAVIQGIEEFAESEVVKVPAAIQSLVRNSVIKKAILKAAGLGSLK